MLIKLITRTTSTVFKSTRIRMLSIFQTGMQLCIKIMIEENVVRVVKNSVALAVADLGGFILPFLPSLTELKQVWRPFLEILRPL